MSNVYITEPPTKGKVLLHTTFGDVDIELWAKEAPRACRNFLQHAVDGYYDGTIFHRIIKDFMVQGGDPTGSGRGGESIYGAPFQDEIHQRIRFNHRGQVAMANSGPGTNASQFFLTLAPCAWLDKKHTIFGKVTGNTIFNVLKVGDTEVDSNDFPRGDPPKLLSIEVLANPFGDMVARSRKGKGRAAGSGAGEDEEEVEELRFDMGGKRKKGKKKKKKKDLNLLSFGIEAGEEEAAVAAKGALGMRSSHDVSVDPKLAKEAAYEEEAHARKKRSRKHSSDRERRREGKSKAKKGGSSKDMGSSGSESDSSVETRRRKRARSAASKKQAAKDAVAKAAARGERGDGAGGGGGAGGGAGAAGDDDGFQSNMRSRLLAQRDKMLGDGATSRKEAAAAKAAENAKRGKEVRDELLKMRREMVASKQRAIKVTTGQQLAATEAKKATEDMLSPLQQLRAKFTARKKRHGSRESSTMAKLAAFRSKLHKTVETAPAAAAESSSAKPAYHGQVLEDADQDDDDSNWMAGQLRFVKHVDDKFRAGKKGSSEAADPLANKHRKLKKNGSDPADDRRRLELSKRRHRHEKSSERW